MAPLFAAAYHGYESGVRILLNAQADMNTLNMSGSTVLHYSTGAGHLTITELLLLAGADSSLASQVGETAVDIALASHHYEVCQLLLMYTETRPHPPLETTGDEGPTLTHQMDHLQLSRDTRPPSSMTPLLPTQQLLMALRHPLKPAGTNKHKEQGEEEEDLI